MSVLTWDQTGEHLYETGVDRGVLFPMTDGEYGAGVAWNGLISVSDSPSGGEVSAIYADNIKYLNLISVEELGATIEAYTYPDEFMACDGSVELATGITIGQQTRQHFGFCYRSRIGNDESADDYGYKIHILYDCLASPSEKQYSTVNDSPEAITLSWEISTNPISLDGYKNAASVVIDSTKVSASLLSSIEDALYGTSTTESKILLPEDIIELAS